MHSENEMSRKDQSCQPISNIIRVQDDGNYNDSRFDRYKKTPIYRIYTLYFRQIASVRWLLIWIWKKLILKYFLFLKMGFNSRAKHIWRWRPLNKLYDFTIKNGIKVNVLQKKEIVETPAPQVFPTSNQFFLDSPHDHYEYPDIYVASVKKGMIYGGSNLIVAGDVVISHDLYDFKHDFTSEELHGRTLIDPKGSRIRWLLNDEHPDKIPAAATFLDACAFNYAHWMTEVLPRIVVFCGDDRFKNIPIVVNDGLHRNIMESLFWVTEPERKILLLPIDKSIYCDTLYVTSVTGYVPFDWRSKKLPDCSHGLFSRQAFMALSKRLEQQSIIIGDPSALPDKIFLRRNSDHRTIINSHEVESFYESRGYLVVEPEKLSFQQQVALFKNAKAIAGSTGAAFANIIFASPDCDIHIFISKHPDTIYWYWQNIACASGIKIKYVLGTISKSKTKGVHASFRIDVDELEAAFPYSE